MKYFRKACAVFMTGLFCWLPVLQPVSLYAETVVYDAQATGAGENVAGGGAVKADDAAAEESSAVDGQDAIDESAEVADVSDQQSNADDQSDQDAGQQDAAASQEAAALAVDAKPADALSADSETPGVSNDETKANSWRYENGALRTDIDPGISLFSVDDLPDGATAQGVIVSEHTGTVDWAAAKKAGVDFAILRLGYGDTGVDAQFAANAKGCRENGIPFGVFVYAYAWDTATAQSEARGTLARLEAAGVSSSDLSLPVYYALENTNPATGLPSGYDAQNQYHDIQGAATFASMAQAFAQILQQKGYSVGMYAKADWWNTYLTDSAFNSWDRLVADFGGSCSYKGTYSAWQYTTAGTVAGVPSAVEMAYWYGDTPWSQDEQSASVQYQAHVQDIGWQKSTVKDGATAGTTGESKSMEALRLSLDTTYSGTIEANAHVADIGWQGWDGDGEVGTTGRSKQMEAIEIRLTGEVANHYDVYYRTHCAEVGWLGWAKNGEPAGTQGRGYGMQAIEIKLVEKGKEAPGSTDKAFVSDGPAVTYRAHVSDIGWQGSVKNGATAGTTGQSKAIEALTASLDNLLPGQEGGIQVRAHVQDIGWQDWTSGQAGTTGKAKHIEAVQIRLTGALADQYDVYYRVHAANIGWMAWTKNGEQAGTQGYGYAMEAIQIKMVEKNGKAPSSSGSVTTDAFRRKPVDVSYRAHVSNIGWQGAVGGGQTAGTTGRSLSMEALQVSLTNQVLAGSVEVRAHVSDIGWQGWTTGTAGTTGRAKAVQAVQIRLTGEMADAYDIYYRVHSSGYGWLDWAKNGDTAGTTGLSCPAEAVQIRLVSKGGAAPGATGTPYISAPTLSYRGYSANIGWGSSVTSGTAGTTGRSLRLEAFSVSYSSDSITGGVSYRAHVANVGWQGTVSNGAMAGTTGQSRQIEAIQISLTGNAANRFDIYYRVYVQDFGWLGWAKNGATAGTTSCGLRVEAFEIAVRAKGAAAPGSTSGSSYSSKASLPYIGYQNPSWCYQVSNKSVNIKNLGSGIFGYRTESRIPYNATRNQIVNTYVTRAMEYLGTRYIWDYACAPGVGVDCAGLVLQSLYAVGMDLSPMNPWDHYHTPGHDHYANDMRASSRFQKVSFANRQVGDLILTAGHVSIYIGGNRIIEAYPGAGVRTNSVYSTTPVLAVARPVV